MANQFLILKMDLSGMIKMNLNLLTNYLQMGEVNIFDQSKNYRLDRRGRILKYKPLKAWMGLFKLKILEEIKIPRQVETTKEKPKPKDKS